MFSHIVLGCNEFLEGTSAGEQIIGRHSDFIIRIGRTRARFC
jgi:hypothetical protein